MLELRGFGFQVCQNYTRTLYIRVTRRGPVTCNKFSLQVMNGL